MAMGTTEALAFPAPALPAWLDPAGLAQSGLDLAPAAEADLSFLRDLYAASRAAELACVPWPQDAKRAFCDSQFALQHRHYLAHCVPALFLIVRLEGRSIGRLYLHWTSSELRIVDILLDASVRGRGIGSTLLRWAQAAALALGAETVSLNVEQHNEAACRLYRRLGFRAQAADGTHLRMVCMPLPAQVS